MDDNNDDHAFSDDDFDSLPVTALLELEQNALRSTQPPQVLTDSHAAPKQQNIPGNQPKPISYSRLAVKYNPPPQYLQTQNRFQAPHLFTNNADSDEDENAATPVEEPFIPRRELGDMAQREQWRQERYSKPIAHGNQTEFRGTRQSVAQSAPHHVQPDRRHLGQGYDPMLLDQDTPHNFGVKPTVKEDELQAHLEKLLRERDELETSLNISKATLLTQKGEIAIIRANLEKESMTHGRQLNSLKRAAEEEAAKHKAHMLHMQAEAEKLVTRNRYLEHNLDEEVDRNAVLQRTRKEKPPDQEIGQPDTTPHRATAQSLRDGFDDTELMLVSPSKSGRRSKGGTPTGANKRKRKPDLQSPIPPLVLRQSTGPVKPQEEQKPASLIEKSAPAIRKDRTAEENLRFIQRILNHRVSGEQERIVESFMRFSFPSEPSKTFASILLEATGRPVSRKLPTEILQILIDLWERSLKEKYYKCIASLIDVVNFVIDLDESVVDLITMQKLLPVLQASGEINGTIRFKNLPVSQQNLNKSKETPRTEVSDEVDASACLEMLYRIACMCLDDEKLIDRFWRSMNMDFVLLMLNSSQPIRDITLMLNLLSTSILPETLGMISSSAEEQSKMETWILDRICYLLWEKPRSDEGEKQYSRADICRLRLAAISLLSKIAHASAPHPHTSATHHGSLLLAGHRSAIARLIRCIYDETDAMYLHSPSHALHADLVNEGIRLVYHLIQNHGEAINIQQKLLAINGGVHKHRVVLTRLAFSEGLFLDAGITQQTVDMATDMLEEAVTPEEAESLVEAFPGYKGRRRTQS